MQTSPGPDILLHPVSNASSSYIFSSPNVSSNPGFNAYSTFQHPLPYHSPFPPYNNPRSPALSLPSSLQPSPFNLPALGLGPPPWVPSHIHPLTLPHYSSFQPVYHHFSPSHTAFHEFPSVQPAYHNQPIPTSFVHRNPLAQVTSPLPLPAVSSTSLPTVTHIPVLTSKLDFFAWDEGINSLIRANNLIGHILDPSVNVDPTRPDLAPTPAPVLSIFSTTQEIDASNRWWADDNIAQYILISRLGRIPQGLLPASNITTRTALSIYKLLRQYYGTSSFTDCIELLSSLHNSMCTTGRVQEFVSKWRTGISKLQSARFDFNIKICISLFVRGLPSIPTFNTLRADLPRRIAAIPDTHDYGAFIDITESVLELDTIFRPTPHSQIPRSSRAPPTSPSTVPAPSASSSTTSDSPSHVSKKEQTCGNCQLRGLRAVGHADGTSFQSGGGMEGRREGYMNNKGRVHAMLAGCLENTFSDRSLPHLSPSSHQKSSSLRNRKTKPSFSNPHYLVIDSILPSHIFHDRSLFTTYAPLRKLHRTLFGTEIIIEGIGDVHVRVFAGGKSILFRFRDCWHVPSSPHHFFSASRAISLGHQIMIAGRSPRMIFSHKRRLVVPDLPKYMPFTRVDHFTVLKFDIPAQDSLSPRPDSDPASTQPFFSLQASSFAAIAFHQSCLLNPQDRDVSFPGYPTHSSANEVVTWDSCQSAHVDVVSDSSKGVQVVLHGGAQALVDGVNAISRGGGDAPSPSSLLMQLDVKREGTIIIGDAGDRAINSYGGDPSTRLMINWSNLNFSDALPLSQLLSLDLFQVDLQVENNFIVHLSSLSSPCISIFSQSFTFILNIARSCSPYSLSFYNSSISPLISFFNFYNKARLQVFYSSSSSFSHNKISPYSFSPSCSTSTLIESPFPTSDQLELLHAIFSPRISVYSIPLLHFSSSQPHDHFVIIPPLQLHFEDFSLVPFIISQVPLTYSCPTFSHLNLISSSPSSHTSAPYVISGGDVFSTGMLRFPSPIQSLFPHHPVGNMPDLISSENLYIEHWGQDLIGETATACRDKKLCLFNLRVFAHPTTINFSLKLVFALPTLTSCFKFRILNDVGHLRVFGALPYWRRLGRRFKLDNG